MSTLAIKCDFVSHSGYGGRRVDCAQCMPDLRQPIKDPGPILMDARADGRKLRWTAMHGREYPAMIRLGITYIGARYDEEAGVWMIGRVHWCSECDRWEVTQNKSFHEKVHTEAHITHFADDILGTP